MYLVHRYLCTHFRRYVFSLQEFKKIFWPWTPRSLIFLTSGWPWSGDPRLILAGGQNLVILWPFRANGHKVPSWEDLTLLLIEWADLLRVHTPDPHLLHNDSLPIKCSRVHLSLTGSYWYPLYFLIALSQNRSLFLYVSHEYGSVLYMMSCL